MVKTFDADNFDVLFKKIINAANQTPQYICEPRGSKIKELIAPTLVLRNPRARLLNIKARKADYGFAVGEFLWYWNGRKDLESLAYYNKRATTFSDDGKTVNSAYGYRTRVWNMPSTNQLSHPSPDVTQWEACKKALLDDNDSRRALLIINFPGDNTIASFEGSKDVPCTLSLQFFIRNNRLILHSHMRSNDIVWGLTYDLFSFTLLQEAMCLELNEAGLPSLELGEYIHTAGSLHLYEQHFKMAEEVVDEASSTKFRKAEKMERLSLKGLALLAEKEEDLRTGRIEKLDTTQFDGGARWMAEQLNNHRKKRDSERK